MPCNVNCVRTPHSWSEMQCPPPSSAKMGNVWRFISMSHMPEYQGVIQMDNLTIMSSYSPVCERMAAEQTTLVLFLIVLSDILFFAITRVLFLAHTVLCVGTVVSTFTFISLCKQCNLVQLYPYKRIVCAGSWWICRCMGNWEFVSVDSWDDYWLKIKQRIHDHIGYVLITKVTSQHVPYVNSCISVRRQLTLIER